MDVIEHKGEAVVVVVNSIKGDLQIHTISLAPATWGLASDCSAVYINSGHDLGLGLDRGRGELAVELLRTIRDVREPCAQEVNVSAATGVSSVWEHIIKDGLFIVLELQARVSPVDSIGADLKWEDRVDIIVGRCDAHQTDVGVELGSHNLVSELAMWNKTVLRHIPKVPAYNLDGSATLAQTSGWPDRNKGFLFVLIVFNRRR